MKITGERSNEAVLAKVYAEILSWQQKESASEQVCGRNSSEAEVTANKEDCCVQL